MWPRGLDSQKPEGLDRSEGGSPGDLVERKKTYEEHREFLESFANYREVREKEA